MLESKEELLKRKKAAMAIYYKLCDALEEENSENMEMTTINYAKFNVCYYMNQTCDTKPMEAIVKELKIDKNIFSKCVAVVKKYDEDLYNAYLKTKKDTSKKINKKNKELIKDLILGLETKEFEDGESFSAIKFLERFPFKGFDKPIKRLYDYVKVMPEARTVTDYVARMNWVPKGGPGLNTDYVLKQELSCTATIKGYQVSDQENDLILNYMYEHGIPVNIRTFLFVRNEYVNSQIAKLSDDNNKKTK